MYTCKKDNVKRNVINAQKIQKMNCSRKRGKISHIAIGVKETSGAKSEQEVL